MALKRPQKEQEKKTHRAVTFVLFSKSDVTQEDHRVQGWKALLNHYSSSCLK